MNQYKFRGLMNAVFLVMMLLFALIFAVTESLSAALVMMTQVPSQIIGLVSQRRMSEREWTAMKAVNDERQKMISGKAAYITWFITMISISVCMSWIALQENELYAPFLWMMLLILIVHLSTFFIAQAILEKRN